MTDPRKPAGGIAGPGGPHDRHGVLIDTREAVLLDDLTVALVEPQKATASLSPGPMYAMQMGGRINQTTDRALILYLFDEDGAAAVITELFALAARMGGDHHANLMAKIRERTRSLERDGHL